MSLGRHKTSPDRHAVTHTRVNDDSDISESYLLGKLLGQGSFGKVYEATHIKTGQKWAVKSINKEKAGSAAMKLVEREVGILKMVNHEHIIQLNEVLESPRKMYLVMEICCGGELADELKKRKYLDERIVRQIMSSLVSAIMYLHKNDIVHRDLKLENILLHNNPEQEGEAWDIKVTDFGLSIVKGSSGMGQDNMMQAFCGTPIYMAPEILDNKTYSRQCDIWALGVLMYILMAGSPPFNASDDEKLYELIRRAQLDFSGDVWSKVSTEAISCIRGMLTTDPAHRLTASEVCSHRFITGKSNKEMANVLEMMKQYNNEMRNGSSSDEINGNDEADANLAPPNLIVQSPSIPSNKSGTDVMQGSSSSTVEQLHSVKPQKVTLTGKSTLNTSKPSSASRQNFAKSKASVSSVSNVSTAGSTNKIGTLSRTSVTSRTSSKSSRVKKK